MFRFLAKLFRRENPELVPYHDFETGKTVLIPKAELRPGVVLVQIQGDKQPVYADASNFQPGPYQHPHFEGEERIAIQSLVTDLAEVLPRTYEEWEDGFRRDRTPDREIAGWLHLAAILKVMTGRFHFDEAHKMECFSVLLACFTGNRDTVRDRSDPNVLSDEQVNLAMKYFYEGGYA